MIISMKRVLPKTLPFVLIVFAIFTVSLTENLQIADGLSAYSDPLIFEIQRGETKMLEWGIVNLGDDPLGIEFYTTGEGSELLVFEEYSVVEAKSVKMLEVYVSIPKDHKDNVEFRPGLFALQRGIEGDAESSGMIFNIQMDTHPIIKIGNNPIYTEPKVADLPITPPKPEIKEVPKVEVKQEETIEEKMARIQAANEDKTSDDTNYTTPFGSNTVDDEWEESFEEEAVSDYVPEPMDAEPVATIEAVDNMGGTDKKECDFFAMFLSWFGIGNC